MIFSELYSAYYNTVAQILSSVIGGERSEKELQKIVTEKAFGESFLSIIPSLKGEKWQLVRPDMTTPLKHRPTLPLTTLQKQWLKAISLDPRMGLFGVEIDGLDGVEPLFTPDDYRIYDKYGDGDPFEDEGYIERFRFLLRAIDKGTPIKLNMTDKNGKNVYTKCVPIRLEYSEKDDKFRLFTRGCHFMPTVNLAKITSVSEYGGQLKTDTKPVKAIQDTVTLVISNERNALERVMLHFAHFEKRAEKIDKDHYSVSLKYDHNDETEIIIRILSFGPLVKVVSPDRVVQQIKDRLLSQKNCNLR